MSTMSATEKIDVTITPGIPILLVVGVVGTSYAARVREMLRARDMLPQARVTVNVKANRLPTHRVVADAVEAAYAQHMHTQDPPVEMSIKQAMQGQDMQIANPPVVLAGINHVVIVGHLTRAPLLTNRQDCLLRIACGHHERGEHGAYGERSNYFDVIVRGALAQTYSRYLEAGARIGISGHLEWREWDLEEGGTVESVRIVAEQVQILD